MKLLSGLDLVDYIKEKQAHDVRSLRQSLGVTPRLAIVVANNDPVIETYVRLKQNYAEDILIDVEVHRVEADKLDAKIDELNDSELVSGVILQLPLADPAKTDEYVARVASNKDVDGLGSDEHFTPATAMAIDWLVNGYNINLKDKKIAIVGSHGRLVGKPLMKLWSKYDPTEFNSDSDMSELKDYNLIVTATGKAGLITSDIIGDHSVVVDAGTASEDGKIVGDVDMELYERDDITITPQKGGVGPLTVAALMDNVIRATRKQVHQK